MSGDFPDEVSALRARVAQLESEVRSLRVAKAAEGSGEENPDVTLRDSGVSTVKYTGADPSVSVGSSLRDLKEESAEGLEAEAAFDVPEEIPEHNLAKSLCQAAKRGDLSGVEKVLACGAYPTLVYKDYTALHYAAEGGSAAVVRLLLHNGASAYATDTVCKNTPLHLAALAGNVEAARILCQSGPLIHAMAYHGDTPLHYAASSGGIDMVKLLCHHGAQVSTRNRSGVTPLDIARSLKKEDPEVYAFLQARDGFLQARDPGAGLSLEPPTGQTVERPVSRCTIS